MRRTTPKLLVAGAASVALLVTACGGDDEEEPAGGETGDQETQTGGSYTVALNEPTLFAPLGDCYESLCSAIVRVVYTGLLEVDSETGDPIYTGAESIETEDNTTFTIKLKPDQVFHDGTPVTAESYAKTWTFNAASEVGTGFWWGKVKGYEDVVGKPDAEIMEGLTVVDDTTLEVELTSAYSQFPLTLAYTPAVAPMADACFDDMEACNEQPIGNGPYKFAQAWAHDDNITLAKNEDYVLDNTGTADEIVFKIYENPSAALRDYQAGNVDVMSPVSAELPTAEQAAGDKLLRGASSSYSFIGLPVYAPGLDNVDVRRALSLAIDRQAIIDNVLNGVGTPADDSISPAVPGYEEGACEYCTFDPDQAKQLYEQGGGLPNDELELFFNQDSGHEPWIEALANMWFNNLGIEVKQTPVEWADHLEKIGLAEQDPAGAADNPDTVKGPFRLGWLMDYPSPENYLRPLYGEGRYVAWINEDFDAALQAGDTAMGDEAIAEYRGAADIVNDQVPFVPISFGESIWIYSDNVSNVNYDIGRANPVYEEIEVVQ